LEPSSGRRCRFLPFWHSERRKMFSLLAGRWLTKLDKLFVVGSKKYALKISFESMSCLSTVEALPNVYICYISTNYLFLWKSLTTLS
jgi:hypothetical protein